MTEADQQMCFENLDEFVNDENKLVTYKWLSRTLSMHVNQAKLALYSFVQQQRNDKDNDDLCVTYFLSGLVKDHDATVYKVQIVPEHRLECVKSTYSVLTSCHVYSIQKGQLKDTNSLYTADYDALKDNILNTNQFSAVSCVAARLRSDEDIKKMTTSKTPDQVPPQSSATVKPAAKPAAPEKTSKNKKPAGIAGMFAKSTKKAPDTDVKPDSSKSEEKDATSKDKGKAKQGGVMNFFAKQAAKPKQESKENESKVMETDSRTSPVKPEPVKKDSPQKKETVKEPEIKRTNKGRKKKAESDDEDPIPQQKKRRRIKQQLTDSSSSEDEMEVESPIPSPAAPDSDPEEIPPTPSPEPQKRKRSPAKHSPVPCTTTSKADTATNNSPVDNVPPDDAETSGKVRKRKLVSKMFVNDEGFMVTEKAYEDTWEEAPETEKPPPSKTTDDKKTTAKNKKSPPPKKPSPKKQSGKQTSLMSFFKKK